MIIWLFRAFIIIMSTVILICTAYVGPIAKLLLCIFVVIVLFVVFDIIKIEYGRRGNG